MADRLRHGNERASDGKVSVEASEYRRQFGDIVKRILETQNDSSVSRGKAVGAAFSAGPVAFVVSDLWGLIGGSEMPTVWCHGISYRSHFASGVS